MPRLFEDADYLLVGKPAGLAVGRRGGASLPATLRALLPPSAGIDAATAGTGGPGTGGPGTGGPVEANTATWQREAGPQMCYGLTRHCSGVLVLAKSTAAAERFDRQVAAGGLRCSFIAVVRGKARRGLQLGDGPRSKGGPGPSPVQGASRASGQAAAELLGQYGGRALVRIGVASPATVPLRAALANRHLPIVGDPRFDPRCGGRLKGCMFLHLESVAFDHPVNGRPIAVRWPLPDGFQDAARGRGPTAAHLSAALAGRAQLMIDPECDAMRVLAGAVDGVPGLMADRLGDVVILHVEQGKFAGDPLPGGGRPSRVSPRGGAPDRRPGRSPPSMGLRGGGRLRSIARWYAANAGAKSVYVKLHPHDRSRSSEAELERLSDPTPLCGRPAQAEFTVREHGVRYVVRPYDGFQTGLFLDQRDNRQRIRQLARGKRVLNTFAYTCSFSVAAAAGGAAQTISVDLSKKSLEWGKRSLAANDMPLDDHLFFCRDTFDYLRTAARQGRRFDVVVLDPPTFARGKRKRDVFHVERDLGPLIRDALGVLEQGGHLLISTNSRHHSAAWLRRQLADAAGRRAFSMTELHPPADFAGDPTAAKSILAHFTE